MLCNACRCVSKRLAGTKSDELPFMSSVRIESVDGVDRTDMFDEFVVTPAAGFSVDRRSTMLLLVAAFDDDDDDDDSPDIFFETKT